MKKLGNEIPWYKPMKLIKRNKDLETLNNTQYVSIKALEEDFKPEYEEQLQIAKNIEEEEQKALNEEYERSRL